MAQPVNQLSLRNTLGAGIEFKENREFNALRKDAFVAQQEQNALRSQQSTQKFNAEQQRANTERLLNGVRLVRGNLNLLPQVGQELVAAGIVDSAGLQGMLEAAQTRPDEFTQGLEDYEAQLMFALSQPPEQPQFGQPVAGVDAEGNPAFRQFDKAGGSQDVEGFSPATGVAAAGAAERFFGSLTADLTAEQQADARLIQLGLEARAGTTSATERIASDSDLTEDVADSKATIAQRRKFGEATGALRSKRIDKGFESIAKIDKNIRNLDRAILAIDQGASTGVIESRFFPSFRESTLRLEQVQKELGLDVIGSVTFGALSKGELDLAIQTALPTGLQPPELRKFLEDKRAAQEKLRLYYSEQIEFLDQGGSVAGFLRSQQRRSNGSPDQQQPQAGQQETGEVFVNPQTGQRIILQNGQWVDAQPGGQ